MGSLSLTGQGEDYPCLTMFYCTWILSLFLISDIKSEERGQNFFLIGESNIFPDQFKILPSVSQNGRSIVSINDFDQDFVEAQYHNIIMELPKQIDEARDVIIADTERTNMIGYTFASAFFVGFFLDTVGLALLQYKSLGETFDKFTTEDFGLVNMLGWYSVGYAGPWLWPEVFNGGDPNLACSSADYLELFGKHQLTMDIEAFTELSEIQATILRERFQRDFNRDLGCILNKKSAYKEASGVLASFQSLQSLVSIHDEIQTSNKPTGANDVLDLDLELETLWGDIISLTDQVYDEVTSRRSHETVVSVFIGVLNIIGMVGAHAVYYNVIDAHFKDSQATGRMLENKNGSEADSTGRILENNSLVQWIFSEDGVDSKSLQTFGSALYFAAPFAWGYSYWMPYFIFLEAADPGCGPLDREEVYNKFAQLGSIGQFLSSGATPPIIRYYLDQWRDELTGGLHCLLNEEEGIQLSDTIDVFYRLALTRLKY